MGIYFGCEPVSKLGAFLCLCLESKTKWGNLTLFCTDTYQIMFFIRPEATLVCLNDPPWLLEPYCSGKTLLYCHGDRFVPSLNSLHVISQHAGWFFRVWYSLAAAARSSLAAHGPNMNRRRRKSYCKWRRTWRQRTRVHFTEARQKAKAMFCELANRNLWGYDCNWWVAKVKGT